MAIGKLKANPVKSVNALKKELKKKGGSDSWLLRVAADSEVDVRILADPDGWVDYSEHFVKEHGFFPCNTGDCVGCDASNRATVKYAVPVLDIANDSVRIMSIGKTVADQLVKNYDKRDGTLLDRDYTIERSGGGQDDTTYYVHPGDRMKRNLKKYEIPDQNAIQEALVNLIPTDEDDEEEEYDKFLPKKKARPAKAAKVTKRRHVPDDDEDDEEDEAPVRKPAKKVTNKPLSKRR